MEIDLENLKDLANKATGGEWVLIRDMEPVDLDINSGWGIYSAGDSEHKLFGCCDCSQPSKEDGDFLAAISPANILALIERINKAEKEVRDARDCHTGTI